MCLALAIALSEIPANLPLVHPLFRLYRKPLPEFGRYRLGLIVRQMATVKVVASSVRIEFLGKTPVNISRLLKKPARCSMVAGVRVDLTDAGMDRMSEQPPKPRALPWSTNRSALRVRQGSPVTSATKHGSRRMGTRWTR